MRKLPPLRAIQVFEAAARQRHFSRAAEELCITQSAVSHQIRLLEEHFNQRLFQREGRRLTLTPKGELLYQESARIFNELSDLNQLIAGKKHQTLRLAVYSSFAVKWLIPRLSEFRRHQPDIQIRLDMITDDPVLSDSVADMFITGQNNQTGYWQQLLHRERLIPVCSPNLLNNTQATDLNWLLKQALLVVDEGPLGLDWQRWAVSNDVAIPNDSEQHLFSHVLLAIEAAIVGQGVALASDFMVANDIAQKRLIALPFAGIDTGFEFNFLCKQRRTNEPAIASFINWLTLQE
ncbi:LysR substrate-binding domain-containing protein [Shewanella colwelliana]|uniref:LysR family transcriptional regulator n=1 Tax=Shewanella colwelliana TaxID=23 RepID=A0A1E5IVG9_SHECO|nr:LysR substrate-binding domain-containing protein [Shewanella colwelliana]MDX1283004.1 LysR substrate-binding domain-containing protein [Shewanella colwelliana]OEG74068.1 LysR family transcriptional regulator [Shewanella colwelliana]